MTTYTLLRRDAGLLRWAVNARRLGARDLRWHFLTRGQAERFISRRIYREVDRRTV